MAKVLIMIQHPTIITLLSVIILAFFYKKRNNPLFNFIALITPVLACISIFYLPQGNIISLFGIELIYEGNAYNKLIGGAFTVVLISANLYSIGQDKKLELLFGNAYGGASFLCLFAGDFISIFVGLELMMVFSSMIIFIGGMKASIRSAKKYFLTHLLSSNMIVVGIAYLITKGKGIALVTATSLLYNPEYESFMLYVMLTGFLINIAIFPFNGWMVNYYPSASPSGFLYLISFTTKVSIVLLAKIFAGYEPLVYVALAMIICGAMNAVFEDNLLSLICLFSIMAMGTMVLAISVGSSGMIEATMSYLFIHVIYKMLLSISVASIIDHTDIQNCSDLKRIKSNIIPATLIIGVTIMLNAPISSSFYIKSYISNEFLGRPAYFVMTFLSFILVFSLPWRQYFVSKKYVDIDLNIYCRLSIIITAIATVVVGLFGAGIFITTNEAIDHNTYTTAQRQLLIMLIAFGVSTVCRANRIHTKPINLVEQIGIAFFYCYQDLLSSYKERKYPTLANLEQSLAKKLPLIHNQQTAIFIVFVALIVMLIMLQI